MWDSRVHCKAIGEVQNSKDENQPLGLGSLLLEKD